MGCFFPPVRTGVDPGRLKHTHARTHRPGQEGEGKIFAAWPVGPLAHWFDSNCTVIGLQDRKGGKWIS